jgi:hypothetical protein
MVATENPDPAISAARITRDPVELVRRSVEMRPRRRNGAIRRHGAQSRR